MMEPRLAAAGEKGQRRVGDGGQWIVKSAWVHKLMRLEYWFFFFLNVIHHIYVFFPRALLTPVLLFLF